VRPEPSGPLIRRPATALAERFETRGLAILRALMRSGSSRTDGWEGVGIAWSIISTLVASLLVLGGLGYLGDRLFDTGKVLTAIGFVLGAGVGCYSVYLQYGKEPRDDD
jgi:F0F1-type ATP synthase assembly protein I